MNTQQIIADNDQRMGGRRLIIESLDGKHHINARRVISNGRTTVGRKVRIAISRIYADSKPRKTGFTLKPKR